METPINDQQTRKEFWIQHIEAAERFNGPLTEYCRIHNLKLGSMSSYRTKLGYSKASKRRIKQVSSNFTPVKVSRTESSSAPGKLPDPKWLAQFLKAWSGQ